MSALLAKWLLLGSVRGRLIRAGRRAATHALGLIPEALSPTTHTLGLILKSLATATHTLGLVLESLSTATHALGLIPEALSATSHALGTILESLSTTSHALGTILESLSATSHALGLIPEALATSSHALRLIPQALSATSHALGTILESLSATSQTLGTILESLCATSHAGAASEAGGAGHLPATGGHLCRSAGILPGAASSYIGRAVLSAGLPGADPAIVRAIVVARPAPCSVALVLPKVPLRPASVDLLATSSGVGARAGRDEGGHAGEDRNAHYRHQDSSGLHDRSFLKKVDRYLVRPGTVPWVRCFGKARGRVRRQRQASHPVTFASSCGHGMRWGRDFWRFCELRAKKSRFADNLEDNWICGPQRVSGRQ